MSVLKLPLLLDLKKKVDELFRPISTTSCPSIIILKHTFNQCVEKCGYGNFDNPYNVLAATQQSVLAATQQSVLAATQQPLLADTQQSLLAATQQSLLAATQQSVLADTQQSVLAATQQSLLAATQQSVLAATQQSLLAATQQSVLAGIHHTPTVRVFDNNTKWSLYVTSRSTCQVT
jgi:hypothetical protein